MDLHGIVEKQIAENQNPGKVMKRFALYCQPGQQQDNPE
jgi:hypothetical protein